MKSDGKVFDAESIRDAILGAIDKPTIVGPFFIVAEIIDVETGEDNLLELHSSDMSSWKELGMLHSRINDIANGLFLMGDEKCDDEDEE